MTELALPAYFDPQRDAGSWELVSGNAGSVRLVVLNPDSGPGRERQQSYADLAARLRAQGVRVVGYVSTEYGARPRSDVRAEVAAYRDWYDLDGVFLDQARSDMAGLDAYEEYVCDARSVGCRSVVLNPGVYPHRAYLDIANLVVTFEGDLEAHRALDVPDWAHDLPARRFCHLVYGVPSEALDEAVGRAALAHAGTVYVTDGSGANPWGHLPSYWDRLAVPA